jgi:hypothetical protein
MSDDDDDEFNPVAFVDRNIMHSSWDKRLIHTRSMTRNIEFWHQTLGENPPWLVDQWLAEHYKKQSERDEVQWHIDYSAIMEKWYKTTWLGCIEYHMFHNALLSLSVIWLWLWYFGIGGASKDYYSREHAKLRESR